MLAMSSKVVQWWAGRDGHAPDWNPLRKSLEREKCAGTVLALTPGTRLFAGQPIWQVKFHREADPVILDLISALIPPKLSPTRREAATLVQVYREFDQSGRFVRDVFREVESDPLPGMVLMRAVWAGGRWCMPEIDQSDIERLIERQRAAFATMEEPYRPVDERPRR